MSEESKISKAQQKAVAKYMKNNYDEIKIRVEKGKREIIRQAAEAAGESVNGYIKKSCRPAHGAGLRKVTEPNKEKKRLNICSFCAILK